MTVLSNQQSYRFVESKRRLFLQKDLLELSQWIDEIEYINTELNALSNIEKQLIKKTEIAHKIQGLRRKNTLSMSVLCKYDQFVKNDIEYGKTDYDVLRSKEHERQRSVFLDLVKDYRNLKKEINHYLFQFQRR